jgi:two-component sensor histidine kinase
VVGVVSDVTERRERENALQAALDARDVLMHEADHRIKNSLQLVASLLSLQMSRAPDAVTKQALGEAMARVDAIANAHLALERSPDLRTIEIDRMLGDLAARVGALNPSVTIRCAACAGVGLDARQAIPLGLLASEALTNALRHAYPPGTPGRISLRTARDGDALELVIADDGKGLPPAPRRPGLGSSLITALGRQIGATVTTDSAPGAGVTITVRLPLAADEGNAATAAAGAGVPLASG